MLVIKELEISYRIFYVCEVVGRVSWRWRRKDVRKGGTATEYRWWLRCVVKWKVVSSKLTNIRVRIERVSGVNIGIWTG